MRVKFFLIALILSLSLVSAVELNNFEIQEPTGLTNYSVYFNSSVWISEYNVTDSGRIQLFNISINSSNSPILYNLNETNSTIEIYDLLGKEAFVFGNGTYQYSQYSTQKNITINSGSNVTIYLDTSIPNVNLYYPLNNSANSTLTQNFSVNITDTYGIKNATIYLFNNTGIYNSTITNFVAGVLKIYLGIPILLIDNMYVWWAEIWDYSGNTFNTGNITFTADSITASGFNVTPGTVITDDYSKDIYINFSELNPSVVKFNWNSTNYTIYDDSLVLFYNFDNRSSLGENDTLVKDISKYGNNGTVYGGSNITWTDNGKYNGAFNFSGGVNYIDLDSNENLLEAESNYSFCAWFYTKETDRQGIVSDRRSLNDVNYTFFGLSSTNKVYLECKDDATATKVLSYDTIGLNEWYHICGIFDSSGLRIYINGSLDNSSTGNCVYNRTNVYTVKVGSYYDFSKTYATNGSIDNLMIWNRSLSVSEISMLYNVSLTKYNSTNYEFYANVSIKNEYLSTTNLNESYDYGLYVNDTAGNSNSTSNTITRVPLLTSTLGNFTINLGNVRSDFYGVNSKSFPSDLTEIDADDDGVLDTASYETWHKEKLLETKLTYLRTAMFLVDSSTGDGTFATSGYANINMKADIVKFAYDNGGKVMLIASGMPNWLANATTGWCNSSVSNLSCPPTNYIKYGELVVDYIDNVTNNGLYNSSIEIEIGNEPDGSSWLNNLSVDNVTKSIEFNKLYNATYDAIKVKYPTIKVGGFGGGSLTFDHPVIYYNFLGNFSDKIDFFSFHKYQSGTGATMMDSTLDAYYDKIISNFSTYNVNCSRIILSETNTYNSTIQNSSSYVNLNGMQFGLIYLGGLNTFPKNLSIMPYTWELQYIYGSNQPEYPYKFQFVSEPELDNEINIPYNVTKNFASYCPAGGRVLDSSSNNSFFETISCCKGNSCNFGIINTDIEAHNSTNNWTNIPSTVRDYETKTAYSSLNKIDLGLIDSYNIKWLGNGIYGEYNGVFWNKPLNEITEKNFNHTSTFNNTEASAYTVEFANMTNVLAFHDNKTLAVGKAINSNDGGKNITIPAFGNITFFNNYNITENYFRAKDLAWIENNTQTFSAKYLYIGYNGTENINVTVIADIGARACSDVASAVFTSNTSTYTTAYASTSITCYGGAVGHTLVGVDVTNLEPATNSNKLVFTFLPGTGYTGPGGGGSSGTENETNATITEIELPDDLSIRDLLTTNLTREQIKEIQDNMIAGIKQGFGDIKAWFKKAFLSFWWISIPLGFAILLKIFKNERKKRRR